MTPRSLRSATQRAKPIEHSPNASNTRSTSNRSRPTPTTLSGPTFPVAIVVPPPVQLAPQGTKAAGSRRMIDTQRRGTASPNVPGPAANVDALPMARSLLDPALCLAADILDDIERVRIANENRLRQLTRNKVDSDGEERGFGLDENHPDVARLAAMVETLKQVEHDATLNLRRKLRKHPLGAWVKAQRGVGEKQGARLLAAIGDPYVNLAKGQPRTVSALWAYCGLHVLPGNHHPFDTQPRDVAGNKHRDTGHGWIDTHGRSAGVAAKRKKGERANWSTKAKMRAYLIAESCIKQLGQQCRGGHGDTQNNTDTSVCSCSAYRVVYDNRRAHTATTHPEWTDGHSHNDGLRVASKTILRDLWIAARDWHNHQKGGGT